MDTPFNSMSSLLTVLSSAPVHAQACCDLAWDEAIRRWAGVMAGVLGEDGGERLLKSGLLEGVGPVRQVLTRYELDCRLRVRVRREHGWSIEAHPLNLGWEAVYGRAGSSEMRLSLCVDVVPLPVTSSAVAGVQVRADNNPPGQSG